MTELQNDDVLSYKNFIIMEPEIVFELILRLVSWVKRKDIFGRRTINNET